MTIRQNLIAPAAILSIFATVSTAHAQSGAPVAGGTPAASSTVSTGTSGGAFADTLKSLNLTPDQQAKITPLMDKLMSDLGGILTPDQIAKLRGQAVAAAPVRGRGMGRNNPYTAAVQELALTPVQQTKIDPIFRDTQAQVRAVRADQTLDPQARATKIRSIIDAMKAQVRPLLTPEQQTKFDAINFQGRGGNRRGNGNVGANNPRVVSPDL